MLLDRGAQILVVYGTFLTLATITVALRFYTRGILIKALGLDDWTTLAGWLLFVLFSAITFAVIIIGFSTRIYTSEGWLILTKLTYISAPFYIFASMLIKFSIAVMVLRVATVHRALRRVIYAVITIYLVCSLITVFASVFQCLPPAFYWTMFEGEKQGHCLSWGTRVGITYVFSGVTCLTDWTLAIAPWFMVRQLQMIAFRTKVMIAIVLGLGSIASIATIARMVYTYKVYHVTTDFRSDSANFLIWTYVELGLSIVASSGATLKPLVVKILPRTRSSTERNNGSGPSEPNSSNRNVHAELSTIRNSLDFSYFEGSSVECHVLKSETTA